MVDQLDPAVSPATPEDELELRRALEKAGQKLGTVEHELRSVEAEWQALSTQRRQYELLERVCSSIEELDEEGIGRMFWGDRASDADVVEHLSEVRGRVAGFGEELTAVDERRASAITKFNDQQDVIELLEEDLYQAIEREERRKQEWLIEREESDLPERPQIMPWTRRMEEDERFRKALAGSVLACLLLGLLIPMIELPIPDREEIVEVPERLAKLIRNEPERPTPPPQPIAEKEPEQKPPEPEPVPEPEVEPQVKPETQVAEVPAPPSTPEAPRKKVASSGLLAFREQFSNLSKSAPSARLGSEARISNAGDAAVGRSERSMVATEGPGSSGGINLAALSRDVGDGGGGGQIEGVQLSRVASSIGPSGTSDRPLSSGAVAGRTDEEIQIVFDRYKAALYRLYNRELRKDPTLRGQMVLRLTIEPDGTVSFCQLQSSDMGAPMLADQVVSRVSDFDFGAKDVPPVTILYPIDFLPTA